MITTLFSVLGVCSLPKLFYISLTYTFFMIDRKELWKFEGQKVKIFEQKMRKGQIIAIENDYIILKSGNNVAKYNIKIPISNIKTVKLNKNKN